MKEKNLVAVCSVRIKESTGKKSPLCYFIMSFHIKCIFNTFLLRSQTISYICARYFMVNNYKWDDFGMSKRESITDSKAQLPKVMILLKSGVFVFSNFNAIDFVMTEQ